MTISSVINKFEEDQKKNILGEFIKQKEIKTFSRDTIKSRKDVLAIEDPLEIQVRHPELNKGLPKSVSITMRTPGHDEDLAVGFLFTEGIIKKPADINSVTQFSPNHVMVNFQANSEVEFGSMERNFYTTSSCGVCGKASIDSIHTTSQVDISADNLSIAASSLYDLQKQLLNHQSVFEQTGGIHAASLFDEQVKFVAVREDVGRHNALDKIVGRMCRSGHLPLRRHILLLSGRASFELIQKAAMAGIPLVVAVGAPSTLAVELAESLDITLIGFLKEASFNVYSHVHRVVEK